jgi:hypothetical protein
MAQVVEFFPRKHKALSSNPDLSKEKGVGKERVIEGMNMIKKYYMHVWKYHNEVPHYVQLICTNKNVIKR